MALSSSSRLRLLGLNTMLNVAIVALIGVNVLVVLALVGGNGEASAVPVAGTSPLTSPATPSTTMGPEGEEGPSRVTFEELQSSLVVALALELQIEDRVTASELVGALPGLTFVNGFSAAGPGIIGIASTDAGIILLTQDGSGSWACAASDLGGGSVLGAATDRGAVDTVAGCGANPR